MKQLIWKLIFWVNGFKYYPIGGGDGEQDWSAENLPKTKEDWNSLREKDPVLWGDLTQQNYDRTFREKKELETKNTGLETQTNNLTVELENYKRKQVSEVPLPVKPVEDGKKEYNINNLPGTQQEWEDLAIENPNLHADLRFSYNQRVQKDSTSFNETQATSRRIVQGEHPDMYLAELDESGQPKKDDKGKIILKVDQHSGEPIFDTNSEKGKLWVGIYNQNPNIASNAQAPELMMAAMERSLRLKGEKMVIDANGNREQQVQDGQVVQDGVQAPAQTVTVTFKNDEEKHHAESMVNRGLYKNLEEYVSNRDTKGTGIYEQNSMPDFTKK